jgi:hypothetical protein
MPPAFDKDAMADEIDNLPSVRASIREHKRLIRGHNADPAPGVPLRITLKVLKKAHAVMNLVAKRMRFNNNHKAPPLGLCGQVLQALINY